MSRVLGTQERTTRMKNQIVARSFYSIPQPATQRHNYVYTSLLANHATQVVQVISTPQTSGSGGWTSYSERCGYPVTYWNPVLGGPETSLGSAVQTGSTWQLNGPDGQEAVGPGWTYVYKYFHVETTITYGYVWFTNDDSGFDWPFEYVTSLSPSEETNIDAYISNSANTYITNPLNETGERTVTVPACSYLVVGVYSADSTAGPGILTVSGLP